MFFASWTWTWVLGTLAATSALVVLIHLLRLRRRRREVAFLPLFEEALGDAASAKRVDWIRRLLALLFSLAIVTALVLSLGDPRTPAGDDGRSIVILVDTSLSMEAREGERSRLAMAKDAARAIVHGLAGDDRAAVVAMGDAPLPLSPLTGDVQTLDHAIDTIARGRGTASVGAALELASDMLSGRPGPEIVVIGDGGYAEAGAALPPEGARLSGVRVGERAENLSIQAFATRRLPLDPSRASVLLRVANHGESAREARIELWSKASIIEAHHVSLAEGEVKTLDLDDVPVIEERLEARLVPTDGIEEGLTADDIAYASISPRRQVRVHVVSPGNLYLEAALLLDPTVSVTESSQGAPLPEGHVDLYVFDRTAPSATVSAPALYIAPPESPAGALPIRLGPKLESPYVEALKREDGLVAGLRFFDVNIKEARALLLADGDVSLGRFGRHTLLARGEREGVPFVVMGFAIEESDLPLRITWPLFLLRTVDALTRRDAVYRPPHREGHPVEIDLAARDGEAEWVPPHGAPRVIPVDEGRVRFVPVDPGVHAIQTDDARVELVVQPTAKTESDLAVPDVLRIADAELGPPSDARSEPLGRPMLALLGFAALLLLLEHLFFHRRWIE
jgi:hypothetical protein